MDHQTEGNCTGRTLCRKLARPPFIGLESMLTDNGAAAEVKMVFTTFPDVEVARTIVRTLVEERLVACGNIIPAVESIYRWKGAIETAEECIVIFKTSCPAAMGERLRALHPYEVAEILEIGVDGSAAYLDWVWESTRTL